MKERIERFARGEFDEQLPKLELPKEPLVWSMEPEKQFTGYLKFYSENGIRVRGYVLSSDGNMRISSPQFYGKTIKLEFTYSSRNTFIGEKKRGKLFLITNAGEFEVPFEVHIEKKPAEGGEGFHE